MSSPDPLAPVYPSPSPTPGTCSPLFPSLTDISLAFVSNNVHPTAISCFYIHNVHREYSSFHIQNCKYMVKP